jgi:hypothetical protein
MKTNTFLVFCCCLFTACTTQTFYQIYKTTPVNGKIESNEIIFEDDNALISYNLWESGGDVGFQFYNKSDIDIIIHLDRSFFVLNGFAYDYYKNRSFTKSANTVSTATYRTYPYGYYNTSVGGHFRLRIRQP